MGNQPMTPISALIERLEGADGGMVLNGEATRFHELASILRLYHVALEFYAGNFDGREGTRWNEDTFFIETKFGSTETADGGKYAYEALAKAAEILEKKG